MNQKKFKKAVRNAAVLHEKGKIKRANLIFNKLRNSASDNALLAHLDFYEGICEKNIGNTERAISLLKGCAESSKKLKYYTQTCMAYFHLGGCFYSLKQYDPACEAYLEAEKYTAIPYFLCEIKACLSEARMASDTVYDTRLFIEPCEYMKGLISQNKYVNPNHFTRTCLVAAQACDAVNLFRKAADYCTLGIENAAGDNNEETVKKAFECAVLLCQCAVQTWDYDFICNSAEAAYKMAASGSFDKEQNDRIILLYTLSLLRKGAIRKAKNALGKFDRRTIENKNIICLRYCDFLCEDEPIFKLIDNCISLIPKNNIDELLNFVEGVISIGFFEAAAELYRYSLKLYPHCRPIILRQYASLLYRLGNYAKSAECYRELIQEEDDAVLNRAYSLASLHSGDIDTAKQQMLLHVEKSENKEEALTLVGNLSLNEGFPPKFSATLYSKLAELLEKKGTSTYEIVDAYNRLGIALYRSEAPLEAELSAFKKAASHAEACEATHNSNLHAVILCNVAECYMRSGDLNKCFDIFNEADKIFSALDDVDLLQYSSCLKFKADILLVNDDKEGAVKSLKRAIELLESHAQDEPSFARQLSLCLNALGTVYFKLGKPELEIPELTKAIDLVKEHPIDDTSLALLYSNRGEAYERTGKYDLMAQDYTESISLAERLEEKDSEIKLSHAAKWLSIGRYREDSLQHSDAISAYKTALSLLDSLSSTEEIESNELTAYAYYQLGNAYCHHNVKDFSSSLSAYSHSLDIQEKLPTSPARKLHLALTYDARAAFYEVFGEHTLAVADCEKAEALRHSLLSDE